MSNFFEIFGMFSFSLIAAVTIVFTIFSLMVHFQNRRNKSKKSNCQEWTMNDNEEYNCRGWIIDCMKEIERLFKKDSEDISWIAKRIQERLEKGSISYWAGFLFEDLIDFRKWKKESMEEIKEISRKWRQQND